MLDTDTLTHPLPVSVDVEPSPVDVAELLDDAAGVDDIDETELVADTRTVDDFDFDSLIATLPLANAALCMEMLDVERKPYIAAARRAGRRNPGAVYYHAVNAPLFKLRKLLQFRVSSLTADEADIHVGSRVAMDALMFVEDLPGHVLRAGDIDAARRLSQRLSEAGGALVSPGDQVPIWANAANVLKLAVKETQENGRSDVLPVKLFVDVCHDINERIAYRSDIGIDVAVKDETVRVGRSQLEYVTELLIMFNHGLALKYARKFTSNTSREDSADMQAAANLGLMRAIASYNPDLGLFGSWAFKPVQRDTLKAVRDVDFSNMTHGDFERRPLILRSLETLTTLNPDRNVTFEEVAAHAGCTLELVQRVLAAPHLDSIHTPVGDEGDTELGDLIPDSGPDIDDAVISALEIDALRTYGLPMLEPRERYVIVRRFGLHGEPSEALSDIGKDLGLSRESVRQHANKGLARLLHPLVLGAIVRGGPPDPAM